jgi:hypothetical protein
MAVLEGTSIVGLVVGSSWDKPRGDVVAEFERGFEQLSPEAGP